MARLFSKATALGVDTRVTEVIAGARSLVQLLLDV